MAGGTSEKTTEQKNVVDPVLVDEYSKNTDIAKFLASLGYQPNRAVTVAAMTPAQEASFASTQNAASAFGMPTAASTGAPTPETSAGGIKGYSTGAGYDEAISKLPAGYSSALEQFYKMIGGGGTGEDDGKITGKKTAGAGTNNGDSHKHEDGNTGALDRVPSQRPKANPKYGNSSSGGGLGGAVGAVGNSISSGLRSMADKIDKKTKSGK